MASQMEVLCGRCGLRMLVPSEAPPPALQCSACNTVIHLRGGGGGGNQEGVRRPPRQLEEPPSPFGRKRAVLCGVEYRGEENELDGCVNDVNDMRSLLVRHMGFPFDSILMLTEKEPNPRNRPTVANIKGAMRWLVAGNRPGDSLVFHFSGHGSWTDDESGDEMDGRDEALCALDGDILDDEINRLLVRPLVSGVKLHAIIDACHSATVLDLPFLCSLQRNGSYEWEDQRESEAYKGTKGGVAFCFSACDDDKLSDTIPAKGKDKGALTHSFIEAAKTKPPPTYGRLLSLMHSSVHEIKSGFAFPHPHFDYSSVSTEPQLSSTKEFDIYATRFFL